MTIYIYTTSDIVDIFKHQVLLHLQSQYRISIFWRYFGGYLTFRAVWNMYVAKTVISDRCVLMVLIGVDPLVEQSVPKINYTWWDIFLTSNNACRPPTVFSRRWRQWWRRLMSVVWQWCDCLVVVVVVVVGLHPIHIHILTPCPATALCTNYAIKKKFLAPGNDVWPKPCSCKPW